MQQGWLGGGWSLALDALPGSPQVPVKGLGKSHQMMPLWSPRSYNPQLLPALGLLGPQIELRTVFSFFHKHSILPAGWPSQVSAQPSN